MSRHISPNKMFYRGADARVQEARKHPAWATFHRECAKAGLFFDDIDPEGKGYGAVTFRIEGSTRHLVSCGKGALPIDATRDAFRAAVAAGFAVAPELEQLFDQIHMLPVPDVAPLQDTIDHVKAMIGEAMAIPDLKEMIG